MNLFMKTKPKQESQQKLDQNTKSERELEKQCWTKITIYQTREK